MTNTLSVDSRLQVGDLAQVIGQHCGDNQWLGMTFVVTGFASGTGWCHACRDKVGEGRWPLDEHGRAWIYTKRIPPLGELEDVQHEEEVHA